MHSFWLLPLLPFFVYAQSEGADPYAPLNATCPKDLAVRNAKSLSDEESKWRDGRLEKVHAALDTYLKNAQIPDFNITEYNEKLKTEDSPVVGLAISGGGTQSGVGGLGLWQAFDARYPPAVAAGTGGLTQILTYITGLSGGGLVTVGALTGNNFSTIAELTKAVNFSTDYLAGPNGNQTEYFTTIFENAGAKAEEGFPVSITDIFGQFFGTYLPEAKKFANFSDTALNGTAFSAHDAPMPLVLLAEVVPGLSPEIGGILYPGNNAINGFNLTVWEVSPLYFGNWAGGRAQAFFPTKYLGTNMSEGKPTSDQCFVGFDKLTFIQGSTGTAFNFYFIDGWYNIPLFAKRAISRLLGRQSSGGDIVVPADQEDSPDVILVNQTASNFGTSFSDALWATYPNPFNNLKDAPTMKNDDYLTLVDGSETGETIPLRPLMTPHRAVDFIIAYDASSDSGEYDWVNGTNLYNTHLAARESGGELLFPDIPDVRTLINSNATQKPTFFGCNATDDKIPLVLYLPNYPWSAYSNYSYQKSAFTDIQLNVTLENAFNLATYGNKSLPNSEGHNWSACLACAVIHKSLKRADIAEPVACSECWTQYCWDGKTNDTEPPASVGGPQGPRLLLNSTLGFEEWNRTVWESEGPADGN